MPQYIEQLNKTIAELSADPKRNKVQLRFLKKLQSKAQDEQD